MENSQSEKNLDPIDPKNADSALEEVSVELDDTLDGILDVEDNAYVMNIASCPAPTS